MNYIFKIQKDQYGYAEHPFGFHVKEAVKYRRWVDKDSSFFLEEEYTNNACSSMVIPVGSLIYVERFIQRNRPEFTIKPRNIPKELLRFSGRETYNVYIEEYEGEYTEKVLKSNDVLKRMYFPKNIAEMNDPFVPQNYQVSSYVPVGDEYRVFIHNKKIMDVKNYRLFDGVWPPKEKLQEMINAWQKQPKSYILDVYMMEGGSKFYVMGIKDFVSCDLYGFCDYTVLLDMLVNGFKEIWFNTTKNSRGET